MSSVVGLSTQELTETNEDLTEQIKECRRKTAMLRIQHRLVTAHLITHRTGSGLLVESTMLRILIEELEQSYEDSKRYVVVQRYRLMKSIITCYQLQRTL